MVISMTHPEIQTDTPPFDALRTMLSRHISGKRLSHTLAVERECRRLAPLFSAPGLLSPADGDRLFISALLHDITKEKTAEEQLLLCRRYRIPLSDYETASPKVLHAMTGGAYAREALRDAGLPPLADDFVCESIRTHTTGDAHMTLMGKLLYLADYIEDTRTFADCVTLRHTFYEGLPPPEDGVGPLLSHLDRTLILSFDMTIGDLISNGAMIDPHTTAARNALLYASKL